MKFRTMALLVSAFLAMSVSISADILYGTTNGTGDAGFWTGGQIFKVDTATGIANVLWNYTPSDHGVLAFGDIAADENGNLFVTYYGQDGFDKFAQVDTSTGALTNIQDLGGSNDQVNALNFLNATLYGVTGGGIPANLLQFTLSPSFAVANLGSLGTNSDGDIAINSMGDVYYTSWEIGNNSELNKVDLVTVTKTGKDIATSSGWAGIEFSADDTLWAGTYWEQKLYTLNYTTSDPTYTATMIYDLSSELGGNITGLTRVVPEPGSLFVLATGSAALLGLTRRRKA